MADISAVAATATLLDADTPDSLLNITFKVGEDFTYASGSVLYFYVLLTDSTPTTPQTRKLTFSATKTGTTFTTASEQVFVIANTTPTMVGTIVATTSKIYYTA